MEGISTGFQTSQEDVILFLIILVGVLVLLIGGQFIVKYLRRGRVRKARARRSQAVNGSSRPKSASPISATLSQFNNRDRETVQRMAWFLKRPGRVGVLLENPKLFHQAAQRAVHEGLITAEAARRASRSAGMPLPAIDQRRHTTRDLPLNQAVIITNSALEQLRGTITNSTKQGLEIKIASRSFNLSPGNAVSATGSTKEGYYQFSGMVASRYGRVVLVGHTKNLQFLQRRQYRRRKVSLPVQVSAPDFRIAPFDTKTIDISIGGVAVVDRHKTLSETISVQLVFASEGKKALSVTGVVVRRSKHGKIAHIRFTSISEDTRFRLFRRSLQSVTH